MKFRSFVLATAIVSAATGFAFAQTSQAPVSSGSGADTGNVQPNQNAGTVKGQNGFGTMNAQPTQKPAQTTGSNTKESKEKDVSPASTAAGIKQEK